MSNHNARRTLQYFLDLPQPKNTVQLTYVWIDGSCQGLRSKTRTVESEPKVPGDCPIWNFDGSSTKQAIGSNSDVYIRPVALYRDPFLGGVNKLVMCDTLTHEMKPHPTNKRAQATIQADKAAAVEPWFGIEQEYTLLDFDGYPLNWPKGGFPPPQGPYYCGVGANKVYCRNLIEAHYRACLYAGIKCCGTNAEVMPAQWEYQVGPCVGVECADQLWMSRYWGSNRIFRYIIHRLGEDFGVLVTFDPKPIPGSWNGAGCHTNMSTKKMREAGGLEVIKSVMPKLEQQHKKHIEAYDPCGGVDNLRRLTGELETSSIDKFTWGVANRNVSVRVPRQVAMDGKGYLEDRRPSSNCDPYAVIEVLLQTVCN